MTLRSTLAFRADHVGSALRPQNLVAARADITEDRLDAEELRAIEDAAILDAIKLQEEFGLKSAADGEFRRTSWHADITYQLGVISKTDEQLQVAFKNAEGTTSFTWAAPKVSGGVKLDHTIFADDFVLLKNHVTSTTPKMTIPSPSMAHYRGGTSSIDPDVDGFFLEYDDARSGGFELHCFQSPGKMVVLGFVTTKKGALDTKAQLQRCIDEAGQFAPLEQLSLSPRCGFSSTVEGNSLTGEEQMVKLCLVVEVADEVWV